MKTFYLHDLNLISRKFLLTCVIIISISSLCAQNTTFPSGSYIVDMGVSPQTYDNGLKPYGMLYDLIKNHKVPVNWIVNASKAKDGVDFNYNGYNYRGGPFVIESSFITSQVASVIANWESQGVQGIYTDSEVTLDVTKKLTYFPRWTIDLTKGSIATPYFELAGIPDTAYSLGYPTELDNCDDLFILPHSDPTWANHQNLGSWNASLANGGNSGWIWSGCHGVSALENTSSTDDYENPDPSTQLNFLTSDGAVLWGDHNDGTPAYDYDHATELSMQFMGGIGLANENGSEQIYFPKITGGWNSDVKIGIYDADHPDIGSLTNGPAAKLAFGRGYGDPTRGMVMYQGGHKLNGGDEADVTAAVRAFFNFSFQSPEEKVPSIGMLNVQSPMEGATAYPVSVSATSPNNSTLNYEWSANVPGTFANPYGASTTFTPDIVADFTPSVITCVITDACGRTVLAADSANIIPAPAPPNALDDDLVTYPNTALTFNPLEDNGNGPDNDPNVNIDPSSIAFTGPTTTINGGVFVLNVDGTVTYTPATDFEGFDTITYQICDTTPPGAPDFGPLCDSATIRIEVTTNDEFGCGPTEYFDGTDCQSALPTIADQTVVLCEDNATIIDLSISGADPQGLPLTITMLSAPSNGAATLNADGTIDYLPNVDFSGSDQIVVQICNSFKLGLCSQATIDLTIPDDACPAGFGKFDPPTNLSFLDEFGSTNSNNSNGTATWTSSWKEKENGTINDPALLNNNGSIKIKNGKLEFKVDNGEEIWRAVDLTGAASAVLTYDWNNGFNNALDQVVFEVSVDNGITYTILDTYTQNSPGNGTATHDLIALFGDASPNTILRFRKIDGNNKTLKIDNLNIAFQSAGCSGPCVALTNQTPFANDDTATIDCGGTSNTENVLSNDTDVDDTVLTANLISGPFSVIDGNPTTTITGSLSLDPSGTYSYTAAANYSGDIIFTYEVCDPNTNCDTATVTITVGNCPPVAQNDAVSTAYNTPITIDVLADNGSGPDSGVAPLTISMVSFPANGLASVNANGTPNDPSDDDIIYTPDTGFTGDDVFAYQICDNLGQCVTATVTVTVINTAPVVVDDNFGNIANECSPIILYVLDDLGSGPDSDPENGTLTITSVSTPAIGTATILNGNRISYLPNSGASGSETFTYQVCDNGSPSACSTGTITIDVSTGQVNQPPVANDDVESTTAEPGSTAVIAVLSDTGNGADFDPEGSALDVSIPATPNISPAGSGTLSTIGKTVVFTPTPGFIGVVTFDYQICDVPDPSQYGSCALPASQCDIGSVTLTVINQAPYAIEDNIYTALNTSVIIDALSNDIEPDAHTIILEASGVPLTTVNGGTLTLNADQTITYDPPTGFLGMDQFIYTICDDIPTPYTECDSNTVTITVTEGLDIEVLQTASSNEAYIGDPVEFIINVSNLSPTIDATNLSITDMLPSGLDYVSDTGGGDYDPATGLWYIGVLPSYESTLIKITAIANATPSVTNTASLQTLSQYDTNNTSNEASVTIITSVFVDTDGDGVPDSLDLCPGFDDADDVDADGIPDGCDMDSDNDGVLDTDDICPGFDDNADWDLDGVPDGCDQDDDNDGITDIVESNGNDPEGDIDGDGIPNWEDDENGGSGDRTPSSYDHDNDLIPNHRDMDSDNDGIYDVVEAGGTDANGDGHADDDDDNVDNSASNGIPTSAGTGLNLIETSNSISDHLNLDSDADGCSDANEAYDNITADGGDDGQYGNSPSTSDSNGLNTAAPYNTGNTQVPAVVTANNDIDGDGLVGICDPDNGPSGSGEIPITLGIDDLDMEDIKVFPNPSSTQITISSPVIIDKVEIYNVLGAKVFVTNNTVIDVSIFNAGLYLLKIKSDNKEVIKRLIIK